MTDFTNPTLRAFAAEALDEQLSALAKEVAGVREAGDIEHIHRMRVASRRLRARLALFAPCLTSKLVTKWQKQVRHITRALGAARDADVQFAFLAEFSQGVTDAQRPGIDRLLLSFRQRREALQPAVLKALDRLEAKRTISAMLGALAKMHTQPVPATHSPALDGLAAEAITARLDAFLDYAPFVHQPDRITELHALRIATKRLRYTLETFAPLFPDRLMAYIQPAKAIQELLGTVHDCDVWAEELSAFPDLKVLAENRRSERNSHYRKFIKLWDRLIKQGLWEQLRDGSRP